MPEPILISVLRPRPRDELAAAAHAVQANVVALRTALCKRTGQSPEDHEIRTPPPGTVRDHRDILIDRQAVKDYDAAELAMRLRQAWGEFAALCWLFHIEEPGRPPSFQALPEDQPMRCPGHVQEKLVEVQTGLWRIRHEQRLRHDTEARRNPQFQKEHEYALTRPVRVFGVDVRFCDDETIFFGACEYAGMLAALRWAMDDRWSWEGPQIMEISPACPS